MEGRHGEVARKVEKSVGLNDRFSVRSFGKWEVRRPLVLPV